jgi:hypothetical protein
MSTTSTSFLIVAGGSEEWILTLEETVMFETCPKCGGTATLQQMKEAFQDIPDLSSPHGKTRVPVKVEEFKCQDTSCEHEFEKVIRESSP